MTKFCGYKAMWPSLILGFVSPISIAGTTAQRESPAIVSTTIADVPMLVAAPRRISKSTALVIMYHGFGSPDSPQRLAEVLPPIPNAVTVYPNLPLVGTRMPAGGIEELLRRQREDYIGQLLYPAMLRAARELPQIVAAVSRTYGLGKSAPLILFGFSAGGAAVLLSLTETRIHPRAAVVVNTPLSIVQAVDSYERQSKIAYTWTDNAEEASRHYDLEKNADLIANANRQLAVLILESEHDAGPTVVSARSAVAALRTAALKYRGEPDIAARVLVGADHAVFEGPGSAAAKQLIIGWLALHAARMPATSSAPLKP